MALHVLGWHMMLILRLMGVLFVAGIGLATLNPAAAATAGASPWVEREHAAVRLISASDTVGVGDNLSLALEFRLARDWKIYWRSPGDAGYPPALDWAGSANIADATIAWPAPERFAVLGLQTIGYKERAVLPVTARLARAGEAADLRVAVDFLACSEICVPYSVDLALHLPGGALAPTDFAHTIAQASARVPTTAALPGLEVLGVDAAGEGDTLTLRVAVAAEPPLTAADVLIEGPADYQFGAPRRIASDDSRVTQFEIPVAGAVRAAGPLRGDVVTVTVIDGERGIERPRTVGTAPADGGAMPDALPTLAWSLVLGLLGGLILNLMPCVLPVLSIKVLAVVGHGGGVPSEVRLGFLAASAGILVSFLILAAAVLAVKATGTAVGWGLQFQQPWFLTAMVIVVTLFAANLWGLFEIRLPGAIADAGAAIGHGHGLGGHFLTGMLATLLATPCSAPFLGSAVGFALARGPAEIITVFVAIGIGLAMPYLAVAAFPGIATRLPRPGRWMIVLRRVLGFALAATAVWLLTVLVATVGVAGALLVAALALVVAALVTWRGRTTGSRRRLAGSGAIAVALLAMVLPPHAAGPAANGGEGAWITLDEQEIARHVAAGRVVYVNVTADWCLTCKVNERLVLGRETVRARLDAPEVVTMQGDWTRPDALIARYLATFGRYGIPFDAVYGPAMPDGEALPELLTPETLMSALDRARGERR